MSATQRAGDDLALDGLIEKLELFRDADVAEDATLNYEITRGLGYPWQGMERARVNLSIESDTPDGSRGFRATVQILCLVQTSDEEDEADKRLHYLKEQVRRALMARTMPDWGLAVGTFGRIEKPSWRRSALGIPEADEDHLAGVWTLDFVYAYEPLELDSLDFTQLTATVDAGGSATYTHGGNP